MQFTTPIHLNHNVDFTIQHPHQMLSIGSCFANMIVQKLRFFKLNISQNPFGIIFNPISIFHILSQNEIEKAHFVERDGRIYLLDYHSEFNFESQNAFVEAVKNENLILAEKLKNIDYLFITFGSAFVYEYAETGKIIANCHKLPSQKFIKRLLKVDEIINSFSTFYNKIITSNPKLKIVFTLSPVRHTKDTLELNAVSKALLRIAIHEIVTYNKNCLYFPAYEIVNDELRDYRFFKSDLIHPNEMAEDFIFEKFEIVFFNKNTQAINEKIKQINQNLLHKVHNEKSESYKNLLIKTDELINSMGQTLDFESEKAFIKMKMIDL